MTLSANLLQSFESVYTDHELATYINVVVKHFICNLSVRSDGQMFLLLIR